MEGNAIIIQICVLDLKREMGRVYGLCLYTHIYVLKKKHIQDDSWD